MPCPPARHFSLPGASDPARQCQAQDCPAGQFLAVTSAGTPPAGSCQPCVPGTFRPATSPAAAVNTGCLLCPAGTFSPSNASAGCTPCPPGAACPPGSSAPLSSEDAALLAAARLAQLAPPWDAASTTAPPVSDDTRALELALGRMDSRTGVVLGVVAALLAALLGAYNFRCRHALPLPQGLLALDFFAYQRPVPPGASPVYLPRRSGLLATAALGLGAVLLVLLLIAANAPACSVQVVPLSVVPSAQLAFDLLLRPLAAPGTPCPPLDDVLTVGGTGPAWAALNRSARLGGDGCCQYRASTATEIRTAYAQTSVVSFSFPWAYQSFVLVLEFPPLADDGLPQQAVTVALEPTAAGGNTTVLRGRSIVQVLATPAALLVTNLGLPGEPAALYAAGYMFQLIDVSLGEAPLGSAQVVGLPGGGAAGGSLSAGGVEVVLQVRMDTQGQLTAWQSRQSLLQLLASAASAVLALGAGARTVVKAFRSRRRAVVRWLRGACGCCCRDRRGGRHPVVSGGESNSLYLQLIHADGASMASDAASSSSLDDLFDSSAGGGGDAVSSVPRATSQLAMMERRLVDVTAALNSALRRLEHQEALLSQQGELFARLSEHRLGFSDSSK